MFVVLYLQQVNLEIVVNMYDFNRLCMCICNVFMDRTYVFMMYVRYISFPFFLFFKLFITDMFSYSHVSDVQHRRRVLTSHVSDDSHQRRVLTSRVSDVGHQRHGFTRRVSSVDISQMRCK